MLGARIRPDSALSDRESRPGEEESHLKVAVSGATGYIGQRLIRRLLAEQQEVLAILQPGELHQLPAAVTCMEDPGTSAGAVDRLRPFHPDIVIHLAASQNLTAQPQAVDDLVEANIAFGARVLCAAADSGARGLVAAGTFMAHMDGTSEYAPQTLYAATKQAFSDLAAYYRRWTPLRVTVLELSDTYGPGDSRPKFLNLLAEACRSGETLDATPGEQTLHPIHVDDVVDAFVHAATMLADGVDLEPVYSVHGAKPVTVRELVDVFAAATGLEPSVRFGGRPYRLNEIMRPYVGDPLPDWSPSVPLEQGLRAIFGSPAVLEHP
jgi:nucleoside-diphosphate-sugar epimerase